MGCLAFLTAKMLFLNELQQIPGTGRNIVHDDPIVDLNDMPGMLGYLWVVGNQHDGDAVFLIQLLEHSQDIFTRMRIEVAGGLVRKNKRRPVDESAGNSHPLLLASRELGGS